jgi:hypothetical protein
MDISAIIFMIIFCGAILGVMGWSIPKVISDDKKKKDKK